MFPDISEHQGIVDWNALGDAYATGQIEAVAMRAGFGTVRVDTQFPRNQAECRARNIPAIYYWFNYPTFNSPQAEATMFNSVVGPLQPNEAMVGDFEDDEPSGSIFPRGQAGVDWANAFQTALQAPQNASWWYTYPYLLSVIPFQQLYGVWPFWLADLSATPDSAFTVPIARQFTNCGSTPGIAGCNDQSRVLKPPLSQWLTGGMEDDMFTDADRARLNDKVFGQLVPATKMWACGGPDQNTYFNIVSQGQTGATSRVTVLAYDATGKVLGVKAYDCIANQPNVHGPTQAGDIAAALGATGPGTTLGFENAGPDDVYVTVH